MSRLLAIVLLILMSTLAASANNCTSTDARITVMCAKACSFDDNSARCDDPNDPGQGNLADGTPPVLCIPLNNDVSRRIHCQLGCERSDDQVRCNPR